MGARTRAHVVGQPHERRGAAVRLHGRRGTALAAHTDMHSSIAATPLTRRPRRAAAGGVGGGDGEMQNPISGGRGAGGRRV